MPIIAYLRHCCRVLGRDPLDPRDAARQLGTIDETWTGRLQLDFDPTLPEIDSGFLLCHYGTDEVSHITLEFPAARLPLTLLEAEFGEWREYTVIHLSAPRECTFTVPQPDLACDCALIAQVRDRPDGAEVVGVSVRRDRRPAA